MSDADFQARLAQAVSDARRKMPMPALFTHYGLSQHCDKQANKRTPCPFCQRNGTFGPFFIKEKEAWTFQCFGDGCRALKANRPCGGDEIGLVGLMENLPSRTPAIWRYLEICGIERPVSEPPRKKETPREPDGAGETPAQEEPPAEPSTSGEPNLTTPAEPPAEEPAPTNIVSFHGGPSAHSGNPPPKPPPSGFGGGERSREIWTRFHSLLQLRRRDREQLTETRGLPDRIIDELGFRSNCQTNEAALHVLREEFPMREILKTGLWKIGPSGKPVIERQFTGWGIVRKYLDEAGKPAEEWGQTERPLIPYLDRFGRIWFMRPHKGNIAKSDRFDDEVCGGHVYCPLLLTKHLEASEGVLILTESEFKAAAVYAASIPALGIPGTGFVRNRKFREELVQILTQFAVREVVIVFDNEDKGVFGLPGFKEDPWDRHDTLVWAKYIAWDLMKRTPKPVSLNQVRIGWLPDAWRKDDSGRDRGKIDWDTALADLCRRNGSAANGIAAAKSAFGEVIGDSVLPGDFEKRFPVEVQRIVGKKLGDLWHDPLLKSGNRKHESLASRFDGLNGKTEPSLVFCARNMSEALRSCVGTYYQRNTPNEKRCAQLLKMKEERSNQIDEQEKVGTEEADLAIKRLKLEKALLQELIEGVPEPISNFTMRCEYCLHTVDGFTKWMVRFHDNIGRKTHSITLDGESMSGLHDFRTFCFTKTKGIASFRGGEKDLQRLNEDMIYSSAHRDIYESDSYGFHKPTRIFFFGDCAYPPDGSEIVPDENNVFWWQSVGYQIEPSSEEVGAHFHQGAPLLRTGDLKNLRIPDELKNQTPLRYLFDEFSSNLFATVGDYDGLFCIGMMLSYACGPEMFAAHGCQPGLWLFGKRSSGKTTIARWLMKIFGFPELTGVRIDKGTTSVGMARDLNQYSFLPFWFDEYRKDVDEQKESVLRGAFDRSSVAKGMPDQTNKVRSMMARTMPLVTGESSSRDSATRSRFGHVLIAQSRRMKHNEKARFAHLNRLSRYLHHLGRYIMQNRARFAELSMTILDRWIGLKTIREQIDDERTRLVHGIGLACFHALGSMLGSSPGLDAEWKLEGDQYSMVEGSQLAGFSRYLVKHSEQAFADVQEETMVNKFWQALVSGINRGEIPRNYFLVGDFFVDHTGKVHEFRHAELTDSEPPTQRRFMFVAAKPVYDLYAADFRRTNGDTAPLTYSDILRESCKELFWIKAPDDKTRVHRVYIQKQRFACWCIDLDLFPFAVDYIDALADQEHSKGAFAEP